MQYLCETARVVGMRTENLQTMEKLKEKLLEYIKEKRQESVKASLVTLSISDPLFHLKDDGT